MREILVEILREILFVPSRKAGFQLDPWISSVGGDDDDEEDER